MGILEGFIRTKKHRKTDSGYIVQSEWTHASSTEFDDGTTLDEKIKSHPQNASDITNGTLGGKVVANSSAVSTLGDKQVRNIYVGETALESGVSALPTGDIYIKYK